MEKIIQETGINFTPQLPSYAANVKKIARRAVNLTAQFGNAKHRGTLQGKSKQDLFSDEIF